MGLEATFQYLARTNNPAAQELLEAALDCPYGLVRELALAALLTKPNRALHRRLFVRLEQFDPACKAIFAKRPDRLVPVVEEIFTQVAGGSKSHSAASKKKSASSTLRSPTPTRKTPTAKNARPEKVLLDPSLQKDFFRACQAVQEFRLYEALPRLVQTVEKLQPGLAASAASTVLELTKLFYAELSAAEKSTKDLKTLRTRLTEALQVSISTFKHHGRKELLEAFLMVAKPQNVVLRRILHDRNDAAHEPLRDILIQSTEGGVLRLLLAFLEDPQAPQAALEVIGRRSDPRFVQIWAEHIGQTPPEIWSQSLSRIRQIAWAQPAHPLWPQLDGKTQAGCIDLLLASRLDRSSLLQILEYLFQEGQPEARRRAAAALAHFPGPKADALLLRMLNDSDPYVQAEAIRQLRPRNIPDAFSLLIPFVDSDQQPVRQALQEALPEFTSKKFLRTFDDLPESLRQMAGFLVRKIDFDAPAMLLAEMQSPSPVRRRRAVEAASAMGAVPELEPHIASLLQDEDHWVRIAAARALADSQSQPTWQALRDALFDRSLVVREEAEKSLQKIAASLSPGSDSTASVVSPGPGTDQAPAYQSS